MSKKFYIVVFIIFLINSLLLSQQSGQVYRKYAVMRGNLVKTVFGNWGVIGQPTNVGFRGAWIYDNNGYVGDISPLVGAEVNAKKTDGTPVFFHSVETCPISRPGIQEVDPSGIKTWTLEPVKGYFNANQGRVALYSDPNSWPPRWPDKVDDSNDPGWPGSWNGIFGKTTTASEETYFVMDDNSDEEFNVAGNNQWNVNFKPDSTNLARNGLGLQVKVRGMQWRDYLAQDCIFWLYEITNTSTTDYAQVVFGMLVGTYVGVTSTEDYGEYDDDYSFYDVEKDIVYTADFDDNVSRNPLWTGEVGVVGYAFLESPGNEHDGIDNDGDAEENPLFPATGPYFTEEDFQSRTIQEGDILVIINDKYERSITTVPDDAFEVSTRGKSNIVLEPGVSKLVEGNIIQDKAGNDILNPNAYNGIDDDLDGLIDENYYLHYYQYREDTEGNVLINKFSPVRHKDYINGIGLNDVLIDEGRADGLDNDGDWNPEFDDVGEDGLPNTGDPGERDGNPTPGEPNFDQTDVDESDQIGLTSFQYFTPAGDVDLSNDEEVWNRVRPGLFEVPKSIQNNVPVNGEDGDFFYGSGYFPLLAGETKWFSLALVYGEGGGPEVDIVDLLKNRETVQKIYNNDYRFPPAPDKPTLTAIPGDGKVTLYWDRKAEDSYDPVLGVRDFEGYKIYKATDNNFNDVFVITDAKGLKKAYQPLAQFDLDNDIKGFFYPKYEVYQGYSGLSYNLGDDTGLQHSYVDYDVENGRRYFYAVVAYDRGSVEENVFPQENDFPIFVESTGEVKTFQNTAVVIPNAPVIGYDRKIPPDSSVVITAINSQGTGSIYYRVVDDQTVNQRYTKAINEFQMAPKYRLEFWDTSNDGEDNDGDWNENLHDVGADGIPNTGDKGEGDDLPTPGEPNIDVNDLDEWFEIKTSFYRIQDLVGVVETFEAQDTFSVKLPHRNLIRETIIVKDQQTNAVIDTTDYIVNCDFGIIRGRTSGKLLFGKMYTISYRHYPVYKSPYITGSRFVKETKDTDIFDGVEIVFQNDWEIKLDKAASGWSDESKAMDYEVDRFIAKLARGYTRPSNYEIQFYDEKVYNTYDNPRDISDSSIPVNFKVYNLTDQKYVDFSYLDLDGNGKLSHLDLLVLVEVSANNDTVYTWQISFIAKKPGDNFDYKSGDKFSVVMDMPFRTGDLYEFNTIKPEVVKQVAKEQIDQIKVVPNPYIVATSHELPLPPAITSGRGERKMDFIHLPAGAKISIFTSRGEHVITLNHDENIHKGTVSWNLKTKENLDIAAGIYFYVVDSPVGGKKGKIAIIK